MLHGASERKKKSSNASYVNSYKAPPMSAEIDGDDRIAAAISVVVNAESSIIPRATPGNTRHAAILVKAAYDGAKMYHRVIGMYKDMPSYGEPIRTSRCRSHGSQDMKTWKATRRQMKGLKQRRKESRWC